MKHVYVLPAWMPASVGEYIAKLMGSANDDHAISIRAAVEKYQPDNIRHEEEHLDYKAAWEKQPKQSAGWRSESRNWSWIQATTAIPLPTPRSPVKPSPANIDGEVAMSLEVKRPVIDVTEARLRDRSRDEDQLDALHCCLRRIFRLAQEDRARQQRVHCARLGGVGGRPLLKISIGETRRVWIFARGGNRNFTNPFPA